MAPLLLVNFLVACTFSVSKLLLANISPLYVVGLRAFITGILLLGYQRIENPQQFFIKKEYFYPLIAITLINECCSATLDFWGFKYIDPTKATIFYAISMFLSPLFGMVFLQETMSLKKWVGIAIGCISIIPIAISHSQQTSFLTSGGYITWPEIALLCSIILEHYAWMHITFLARNNYPSIMINGITGFSGGIVVLGTAFYIEPWKRFDNIFLMLFYFLILIASNLICSNALTSLSKYYSYALMNITSLTLPLYVALVQYIIFGDKITSDTIIALILLFIGICIMYHDEFYNGFLKTTLLS